MNKKRSMENADFVVNASDYPYSSNQDHLELEMRKENILDCTRETIDESKRIDFISNIRNNVAVENDILIRNIEESKNSENNSSSFDSFEKYVPIMEVRCSSTNGEGLFALRQFKSGDVICRCIGEIIKSRTKYSIQMSTDDHFEPKSTMENQKINAVAKINHACDPTSYAEYDKKSGFLVIKAIKNISVDDEITINYYSTETEIAFPFDCWCMTHKCRVGF